MKDSCSHKRQDQHISVLAQDVNSVIVQSQRTLVIAQPVEIQLKENMVRSIHSDLDLCELIS
jgi:propanediol utilization protein